MMGASPSGTAGQMMIFWNAGRAVGHDLQSSKGTAALELERTDC